MVEAGVRMSIGESLIGIGEAARAIPHLQQGLKLCRAVVGTNHVATLNAMGVLGWAYREAGQLDQAVPLLEETMNLRKAKLGPDHPSTLNAMNNLASAYRAAGQINKALPLREETLQRRQATLGPDDPETLGAAVNLATAYQAAGKPEQARPLLEETLRLMKDKLPPGHPYTLNAMNSLANVYRDAGQLDRALPLLKDVVELRSISQGSNHTLTLSAMKKLASAYYQTAGGLDQALRVFEQTLRLTEAKRGPGHPETIGTMNQLADVLGRQGKWKECADIFTALIQRAPTDNFCYGSLATLLAASGDLENYRRCCQEIVACFGKTTELFVGFRMAERCSILPSSGADPEAVGKMADVAAAAGPTNRFFTYFQCTKGLTEYRRGNFTNAVHYAGKTTAAIREHPGDYEWDDHLCLEAYAVSAMAHFRLKQTDAALAALAEANRIAAQLPKPGSEDFGHEWRDWVLAHKLFEEATALIEGSPESKTQTK